MIPVERHAHAKPRWAVRITRPTRTRAVHSAFRLSAAVLYACVVMLLAAMISSGSILAAIAMKVPPLPAIGLGGVISAAVGCGGALLRRQTLHRRSWIASLIVASLASTALILMPTPGIAVEPTGMMTSDGSLVLVRVNDRPGDATPVVAVHGGPGIPFTEKEEEALLDVIPDRTVVVFDQVGAGGATRLEQPSGYTVERAEAELAAVVGSLGAPRVILLGFSDGAGLTLRYAAAHPSQVAGIVMVSPGPIASSGSAPENYQPQTRLDGGATFALYAEAIQPRNLFMYLMTRIDPDSANVFGGDAEMDARFLRLVSLTSPGMHCADGQHAAPRFPHGPPGHYLNQVRQWHPSTLTATDAIRLEHVPVSILRGECDYIPRAEAERTAAMLTESRVVDVAHAGHAILEDRPDVLRLVLAEFLTSEISSGSSEW